MTHGLALHGLKPPPLPPRHPSRSSRPFRHSVHRSRRRSCRPPHRRPRGRPRRPSPPSPAAPCGGSRCAGAAAQPRSCRPSAELPPVAELPPELAPPLPAVPLHPTRRRSTRHRSLCSHPTRLRSPCSRPMRSPPALARHFRFQLNLRPTNKPSRRPRCPRKTSRRGCYDSRGLRMVLMCPCSAAAIEAAFGSCFYRDMGGGGETGIVARHEVATPGRRRVSASSRSPEQPSGAVRGGDAHVLHRARVVRELGGQPGGDCRQVVVARHREAVAGQHPAHLPGRE